MASQPKADDNNNNNNNNNKPFLPPLSSFDLTPIELSLQQCTTLLHTIDQQTQLLQRWQQEQSKCKEVLSLIAQLHVWQQQLSAQPCISVKLHSTHSVPSLSHSGLPHCSVSIDLQNLHQKLVLPTPREMCSISASLSVAAPAGALKHGSTSATLTHHVQLIPTKQQLQPNETLQLDLPLPSELVGRSQLHKAAINFDLVAQYCVTQPRPAVAGKADDGDARETPTSAAAATPTYVLHLPLGHIQVTHNDLKLLQTTDASSVVGSKEWYQTLLQQNSTQSVKA